ncbi:MAG: protoporphyrinogen oxidase HemJ [Helicobacteraceae bacterium]|nr:protoporphyrinogen oxidase HemJ [Helicobacteraceae bacterium]
MYAWIMWLHVISMISWFAALFYLPRLFIYHTENKDNEGFTKIVKVQEYKLYYYIGLPAMYATVLSGIALAFLYPTNIFTTGGWFHAKLFFIAILIVFFFSINVYRKQLENETCTKSSKWFRVYNEVPTILMMLIVAMVVVKPF